MKKNILFLFCCLLTVQNIKASGWFERLFGAGCCNDNSVNIRPVLAVITQTVVSQTTVNQTVIHQTVIHQGSSNTNGSTDLEEVSVDNLGLRSRIHQTTPLASALASRQESNVSSLSSGDAVIPEGRPFSPRDNSEVMPHQEGLQSGSLGTAHQDSSASSQNLLGTRAVANSSSQDYNHSHSSVIGDDNMLGSWSGDVGQVLGARRVESFSYNSNLRNLSNHSSILDEDNMLGNNNSRGLSRESSGSSQDIEGPRRVNSFSQYAQARPGYRLPVGVSMRSLLKENNPVRLIGSTFRQDRVVYEYNQELHQFIPQGTTNE